MADVVLDGSGKDLVDVNLYLRAMRATFEPQYCLLLYASTTDESLLHQALKASGSTDEDEPTAASKGSSSLDVGKSMASIMTLLDKLHGLHLVLFERGDTGLSQR